MLEGDDEFIHLEFIDDDDRLQEGNNIHINKVISVSSIYQYSYMFIFFF